MRWPWRARDQDLDEEIRAHLAMAIRERIERGEAPRDAEQSALREFGSRALVSEATREVWGWSRIERLWQDVRYALRMMRRSPGFTAVVVLSLALGIGANSAIFSLVNVLMLRGLPVRNPDQLVELLQQYPGDPRLNSFSPTEYRHLRDHNNALSGLIAISAKRAAVRGEDGGTETLETELVTGNYFQVLGVNPVIGRFITPEDGRPGAASPPVAVLSWDYWRDRFNFDPGVLGKRITVGNTPATIIGVAPREFTGLRMWLRTPLWLSGAEGGALIGRLRSGVSRQQALAQAATLYTQAQQLERSPLTGRLKLSMESARTGIAMPVLRDSFAKPLIALMAIVALLLLLACANVAGMLLARAAAREREMALRVSLGAGRWRLVRQALTEALLLSVAGALAAVALAWFAATVLVRVIASGRRIPGLPENLELNTRPDLNVLLFTAGIAVLTGLLFGLAPALRAMATSPAGSLKAAGRSGDTRRSRRFAACLVAGQVALSVVLLSAAGQFIEHLSALRNNIGFERDHLLLVTLDSARSGLSPAQRTISYRELLERLEAIPGVLSATLCAPTPISGAGAARFVSVEGFSEKPEDRLYVALAWVAPKYFRTLETPLLEGRDFTFQDQGGPRVAIINQKMARYYFGNRSPIGGQIRIDKGGDQPYTVVGVVADSKYHDPDESPQRTIYFNAFQEDRVQSNFALRTAVTPWSVVPTVRRTVAEVAKGVSVQRVTTMAAQVDAALVPERLVALLSGAFGGLGTILAAIGLYGLLAYGVARRTNEIGVRMAVGATGGSVSRMVLTSALKTAVAGIAVGLPVAIGGKHVAAHLIEDLPTGSAVPLALSAVVILAVTIIAAYIPARRAARVDPIEALRYE